MDRWPLYRNIRARGQLELFLVSAVTSLMLVRFYLHIADYPKIGGDGLHIAHMLWGGLLMMAGIAIALSFLGKFAHRLAAVIGGAGFGVFIDELGKFITHDNDYFFRPAIGLIYAIFVILYLSFNYISRQRETLSSREYQMNALVQLEDAVSHDMDPNEKHQALELLDKAEDTQLTRHLKELIRQIPTAPAPAPNALSRFARVADEHYVIFWRQRGSHRLVRWFFLAAAGLLLLLVLFASYLNLNDIRDLVTGTVTYGEWLVVGQLLSAAVATGFIIKGAMIIRNRRVRAFELFRQATLINILLTHFFIFTRIQFAALPSFLLHVGLLLLISYVLHQEHREHIGGNNEA